MDVLLLFFLVIVEGRGRRVDVSDMYSAEFYVIASNSPSWVPATMNVTNVTNSIAPGDGDVVTATGLPFRSELPSTHPTVTVIPYEGGTPSILESDDADTTPSSVSPIISDPVIKLCTLQKSINAHR